ncbi:MAG: hypothetical protein ABFD97_14460 [Syntrophobacter sp.]
MLTPPCNPDQAEGCDGRTIRELCRGCGKNPAARQKASPYAASLFRVHLLQDAGFRFENDSFGLGFWFDLAILKQKIREQEK